MTRNLKLAFFASAVLAASGCLGGYQAPTDNGGSNSGSNGNNSNGSGSGNGSGTGGGNGSGTGAGTGTGTGTGGGADGGAAPGASSAKPNFDANVSPIIMAKCANATCHGGTTVNPPSFAAGGAANLYNTMLNFSSTLFPGFDATKAQLLLTITPGTHFATYTSDEVTKITNWLNAEKVARAGTTTTSPRDLLLQKFSGCMLQTDFDTAGVATAWANKTTNTTNTACQQCHVNGQGFLANADSTRMFNILTTAPNPKGGWFLEMFFTVDTTDPNNLKMIINRDLINRAATGIDQHELFAIDTDRNGTNPSAYTRLTTFFNTTLAHMTAGTCGPSKLGTTPQ
jgi:hypothetical protein